MRCIFFDFLCGLKGRGDLTCKNGHGEESLLIFFDLEQLGGAFLPFKFTEEG